MPASRSKSKRGAEQPQQSPSDLKSSEVDDPIPPSSLPQTTLKAVELLVLAAIYSPVSQLTLSPVYGSIPSAIHHHRLMMSAVVLGWIAKNRMRLYLPTYLANILPLLAFSIPVIQYYLFSYSGRLGSFYGPLVTEAVTYFPLVVLSVSSAGILLEAVDLGHYGQRIRYAVPAILSYTIFSATENASTYFIKQYIGSSPILTRMGLQHVLATFLALLLPSRLLILAPLPILHSTLLNVHMPLDLTTSRLNSTLHQSGFAIVDRRESSTGYLAVIDNLKDGFRVMRCDHSLLGGEWFKSYQGHASAIKEPIYSVFVMLEAVRLVETKSMNQLPEIPDNQRNALVIGLGIGTTPSALVAHGVQTTIVEIDPVVYDLASKYFALPKNHTSIIADARAFVVRAQISGWQHYSYDYIIHDVFTGGAEPVELFTQEFLLGLKDLLKSDGVIAINYAGDLLLPSASTIVHTVLSTFPSCRLFREDESPAGFSDSESTAERDFTNMVMFCRKTTEAFGFRGIVESDCLGTQARRYHLYPKHEVLPEYFFKNGHEVHVLREGLTSSLNAYQQRSASEHWNIMRTVLPDSVWENW